MSSIKSKLYPSLEDNCIAVTHVIPSFICKSECSFVIDSNRNVYSFGKNNGNLGHDDENNISPMKQIIQLTNIKMVDCGDKFTICIDFEGNLFSFGNNDKGQLGINIELTSKEYIPQRVTTLPPIDSISCGNHFTVCITNEGLVYSFGYNSAGELGIGNLSSFGNPLQVKGIEDAELISCGGYHCICKTAYDKIYSWGYNKTFQLGNGKVKSCNIPKECKNWPEDIISIKSGGIHNLLLTKSGNVYSFGSNKFYLFSAGQLGLNDRNIDKIDIPTLIKDIPLIKRIECGYNHSLCIDINDNLWVFGFNLLEQLGLGDKVAKYKPTLNESFHDIIDISSGGNHTFVKTINNEIYTFGNNGYSQLGIKTSEKNQLTPIQVFKDNEDIWITNTKRSKQKSARK